MFCRRTSREKALKRTALKTASWHLGALGINRGADVQEQELTASRAFGRALTQTSEAARVNFTVSVELWVLPRLLGKATALVRWLHLRSQVMGQNLGSWTVQELLSVIALRGLGKKKLPGAEQEIKKPWRSPSNIFSQMIFFYDINFFGQKIKHF